MKLGAKRIFILLMVWSLGNSLGAVEMAAWSQSRMAHSVYFCRVKTGLQPLGQVDSVRRTAFSGSDVSSILRLHMAGDARGKKILLLKIIPQRGILVPAALPRIREDVQRLRLRPQDVFETPLLAGSYAFSPGKKCDFEVVEDFGIPDARRRYFCNGNCPENEKCEAIRLIGKSLAHLHFGNAEVIHCGGDNNYHAYRHGDFNYRNVLVDLDSEKVAFIDGLGLCMAPVGGDVRTFLYVLWHQFLRPQRKSPERQFLQFSNLTQAFVEAYGQEADRLIDRNRFQEFDGPHFAKFHAATALHMLKYRLRQAPEKFVEKRDGVRCEYFLKHHREIWGSWDFSADERQQISRIAAQ